MINMNLAYVVLPLDSEDMDDMRRWYEAQLDLDTVLKADDRFVMAGKNGFAVEFRTGTPLDDPDRVVLAYVTNEVDVIFERMRESMFFAGGPEDTEWGRRVIRIKDPVGHTIEILEVDEEEDMEDLRIYRRDADE